MLIEGEIGQTGHFTLKKGIILEKLSCSLGLILITPRRKFKAKVISKINNG